MIAAAASPAQPARRGLAAEAAGQRLCLGDVVEAELGGDPLALRPDPDLVAER